MSWADVRFRVGTEPAEGNNAKKGWFQAVASVRKMSSAPKDCPQSPPASIATVGRAKEPFGEKLLPLQRYR